MVGARVPQDWQQQIQAIADLQDRVASLERKLVGLGRLVG
jgi:hypothetical protein